MARQSAGIPERLGKAIARERMARGLTQEQLAEIIGVEQETVSRFERGATLPPLPRLIQLADYFDVPLESLLRANSNRIADEATDIAEMLSKLDSPNRDFVRRWVTEMCERLAKRK
ncbi:MULTISPECIES: helix-turn-helix domain-containing protein [Burkholderia]|uniref:Helix-turn-helix transcriptional regulator n=1 Tax=Burkholderia sola TaxID=2843302 RepID=A0ABV2CGC4_9BURK|nr:MULTISPECIES: helix-turn-helix transcriptional regulator [Burkholderia]MBN3831575.1 helix-turn-helix transcriptional regulator [Burkholderia sp. Ac-20344]MBP0610204.1 helix-turn-helix transcriptional regulator [Burkholderia sp. CpTa8-5]PAJ96075.1 transcriptional regulator [Burkholderia ubonensis]RQP73495.1 XRE family transcriptional regulator [Burkholderia ubonensis]